jgi:hypothetical protein
MRGIDERDDVADRQMASSRLPAYLLAVVRYPLRGHAPPVIVVITLLLALGSASLVALLPLIVGVMWTAHYGLRIVEHTSYGHARPPRLTGDALMLTDAFTWSAMLMPGVVIVLHVQGSGTVAACIAVLLPAHWIALATTRSLLTALNPVKLAQIIVVTGWSYIATCALLWAAARLAGTLEGAVSSVLSIAACLYLLFAGCHLLGFVAYQRHERLGMGVHVERPSRLRELEAAQAQRLDQLMARIEPLHRARDDEAAARLLFESVPGPADEHRFHEVLFERLKALPARGLALTQAARLIGFLIGRRRLDRALEIAENALDLDPRFRTESVLHLASLCEQAWQTRRYALLDRLLTGPAESFGSEPDARRLDGLRMRLLIERDRDEAAARRLLSALGPLEGHPCEQELGAYARLLSTGRSLTSDRPAPGPASDR